MKKRFFLVLIIILITTSFSYIHATESNLVNPKSYVDEVVDYTKEIYSYDQWGNPVRIDSQTYYKTITFQNGYELIDTTEEIDAYLLGFTVYTYYNYNIY